MEILENGRIAETVNKNTRPFNMQICALRRNAGQSSTDGLTLLGGPDLLHEILRRSDYLVISMPATPETIGCIGRAQLGLMKPSAFLVNVARAEIIDEEALYD